MVKAFCKSHVGENSFRETLYIRSTDTSRVLKYRSMRMIRRMLRAKEWRSVLLFLISRWFSFSERCKSTIVISCRFSITSSAWAIAFLSPVRILFLACPAAKVKKKNAKFLTLAYAKFFHIFALQHSVALQWLKPRIFKKIDR